MALRWDWLLGGLAVSVLLTALLWWLTGTFVALFLLVPFLLLPRRRPKPTCPTCGHAAAPGDRFCPRDGTPLAQSTS